MNTLSRIENAPLSSPMAMVCDVCDHVSSIEFVSFSADGSWYWQCKFCHDYNTYDSEHEYADV